MIIAAKRKKISINAHPGDCSLKKVETIIHSVPTEAEKGLELVSPHGIQIYSRFSRLRFPSTYKAASIPAQKPSLEDSSPVCLKCCTIPKVQLPEIPWRRSTQLKSIVQSTGLIQRLMKLWFGLPENSYQLKKVFSFNDHTVGDEFLIIAI